jgi:F420-non-reducing hydrogenase iron-sulfur subunit
MGVNALVHKILGEIGINQERFNLKWASAAEAPRFVQLITDFTAKVKELGPLGHSEGIDPEELKARLDKAVALVNSKKLRMTFGTTTKALRKDNDHSEAHISEVINEKLSKAVSAGL